MSKTHLTVSSGMSFIFGLLVTVNSGYAAPLQIDNYQVMAGKAWIISQDMLIDTLVLDAGAVIARPGKSVTMLVDGKEVPIEKGTYQHVELRVSDKFNRSPVGDNARGVDDFRAALYVDENGISDTYSITEAISQGEYDSHLATGIGITSRSQNFNGIMINGPVTYTIDNAALDFRGDGDGSEVSDFSGYGAAIAAYNGAQVTVENSDIHAAGVARLAVFAYEDADVLVKNSRLKVDGGELYEGYPNSADFSIMVAPPWVLGITGSARGTNMMGNRTSFTLVDSEVESANWGVVSTDMGSAMLLTIVDSTLALTGDKDRFSTRYGSGYGTYILGSEQYYYGVTIKAGTYGGILRDGEAYYGASTFEEPLAIYPRLQIPTGKSRVNFFGDEEPVFDVKPEGTPVFSGIVGKGNVSVIESDNFGWMSHGDGKLVVTDGTRVETGRTLFLLKEGNVDITVSNQVDLIPGNGVLLQLMDNDDSLVGIQSDSGLMPHFNTAFSEKAGYPGLDYIIGEVTKEGSEEVHFTAKNVSLSGDLYNATGYFGGQPGDTLNVVLDAGSILKGRISAASAIHVDENGKQNTHFTQEQYYYLGHVANKAYRNGVNTVNVTLKEGSTWQVTESGLLDSLSIEEGSTLAGADGRTLQLIDDGKVTAIRPGVYTGKLELKLL